MGQCIYVAETRDGRESEMGLAHVPSAICDMLRAGRVDHVTAPEFLRRYEEWGQQFRKRSGEGGS